jgi:3-hydroxy-9,10-secoandrosta-1,3,5(10)-triene-9,17-dione monooxygenase
LSRQHRNVRQAAESPLLHHQLAKAQFELEIAEMYMERMRLLMLQTWAREATVFERVKSRASLGQIATHARACVNILFEAGGTSQVLDSDMQRYFRDINVIHQHAAIQPNSSAELYGRMLAGLAPDIDFF